MTASPTPQHMHIEGLGSYLVRTERAHGSSDLLRSAGIFNEDFFLFLYLLSPWQAGMAITTVCKLFLTYPPLFEFPECLPRN